MDKANFIEKPETNKWKEADNINNNPMSEQNSVLQDFNPGKRPNDAASEAERTKKKRRANKEEKDENASTENEKTLFTILGIPPPVFKPEAVPLTGTDLPYVIFDLETTDYCKVRDTRHITQLAAISSSSSFSQFVKPKTPMGQRVTDITGLYYDSSEQQMYSSGKAVESVSIQQALDNFFQFLGNQPVILVGHNIRSFDCNVLFDALESCNANGKLQNITGFLDTLKLIKKTHPRVEKKFEDATPHSQENLYASFFNGKYNAHDALEDVKALQRIFLHVKSANEDEVLKSTIDRESMHAIWKYNSTMKQKRASYERAIFNKVISKFMAGRAAGSGLTYDHLMHAYILKGTDGVRQVLSDTISTGKPRVTKNMQVINKLSQFIADEESM